MIRFKKVALCLKRVWEKKERVGDISKRQLSRYS